MGHHHSFVSERISSFKVHSGKLLQLWNPYKENKCTIYIRPWNHKKWNATYMHENATISFHYGNTINTLTLTVGSEVHERLDKWLNWLQIYSNHCMPLISIKSVPSVMYVKAIQHGSNKNTAMFSSWANFLLFTFLSQKPAGCLLFHFLIIFSKHESQWWIHHWE